MAVITRARKNLTFAQVIYAAVADVSPPGSVLLNEANRTGSARPLFERQAHANAHDFLMRAAESHVQEPQWIKQGLGRMPERFKKSLLRDLGGACTIGVPAHPIDHDEQNRMLGNCRDDTILVFFARPEQ